MVIVTFSRKWNVPKSQLHFSGKILSVAAIQRVMQELHFDFFTRGKIPSKKSDLAKQEQQKMSGIRLGVIYGLLRRARR